MATTIDLALTPAISPRAWSEASSWLDLDAQAPEWVVYRVRCAEGLSRLTRCELWLVRADTPPGPPPDGPRTIYDRTRDRIDDMKNYDDPIDSAVAAGDADAFGQAVSDYAGALGRNVGDELGDAVTSLSDIEENYFGMGEEQTRWVGKPPPRPEEFVGTFRSFRIARRGDAEELLHGRWVSGVVDEMEDLGFLASYYRMIRVVIVPQLKVLAYRSGCRIYQDKTTLDVVREVVERAGIYGQGIEIDPAAAGRLATMPVRQYCVQYDETDLDFVRRLLEEDGLVFRFRHQLGCEQLVIGEGASCGAGPLPCWDSLDTATVERLPLVTRSEAGQRSDETAWSLRVARRPAIDAVIHRDYNFAASRSFIETTAPTPAQVKASPAVPLPFELYEYPGGAELARSGAEEQQNQREHARYRLEAVLAAERAGRGVSNAVAMAPGAIATIEDHRQDAGAYHESVSPEGRFLVTGVEHFAQVGSRVLGEGAGPGAGPEPGGEAAAAALGDYTNVFSCIPADRPFRTSRTAPRPVIDGPQTAVVVGNPGTDPTKVESAEAARDADYVSLDDLGRVQVRFHWDRRDAEPNGYDQARSCWIRVAQPWAGDSWGTTFIPRAGMEAVVEFIDGDPDQPVITGFVHSPTNRFPVERKHLDLTGTNRVSEVGDRLHYKKDMGYTPVEDRHINMLRTQSHVAGVGTSPLRARGFHELSFCDTPGRERLRLHSEGDLEETVVRNHSTEVEKDQLNVVQGNQVERIGRDQTLEVEGKRVKKVEGHEHDIVEHDRSLTVNGPATLKVDGNRSEDVKGAETIEIGPAEAGAVKRELKVRGHRRVEGLGNDTLTVGADRKLLVRGQYKATGSPLSMKAAPPAPGAQTSTVGAEDGNLKMEALGEPGEIEIVAHGGEGERGSVSVRGKAVTIQSKATAPPAGVRFECGAVWLEVGPDAIAMNAPKGVTLQCGGSSVTIGPALQGDTITHEHVVMMVRNEPVQQDPAAFEPEAPEKPGIFYLRMKATGAATPSGDAPPPEVAASDDQLHAAGSDDLNREVGASSGASVADLIDEPGILMTSGDITISASGGIVVKSQKGVNIQDRDEAGTYTNTRLLSEHEEDLVKQTQAEEAKLKQMEDELVTLEQDVQKATEDYAAKRQALLENEKQISEKASEDYKDALDDFKEARTKYYEAEQKKREAEQKLAEAKARGETDLEDLQDDVDDANADYDDAKEDYDEAKKDLDDESGECKELDDEHDQKVADYEAAKTKYEEAVEKRDAKRAEIEAQRQKVSQLRDRVSRETTPRTQG
jgi:type VI secretion system secreted protein VgrG